MNRKSDIKDFVKNILGCTCPDKVFEQIEDKHIVASSSPHTRSITIGGRLLIYIWEVDNLDRFNEKLFGLLEAGRKQRDKQGLNRFRAVLAVHGATQNVEPEASSYFLQFTGRDDRMHIHVITASVLEDL